MRCSSSPPPCRSRTRGSGPTEHARLADELHRRFDVPGSDLLSIVALWDHLRERQRALSANQFRKLCRAEHLNYLPRAGVAGPLQSAPTRRRRPRHPRPCRARPRDPDRVHQAVLAGLLSHIGMRDRDGREFRGARGASFTIAAGSVLARKRRRGG